MIVKVLPLEGLDSYWALHSYGKLLYGLKMLPMYMQESYEEFFARVEQMPVADRRLLVREAINLVTLEEKELLAFMRFTVDANGVPYTKENSKRLKPNELMELALAVALECAAIDNHFVTDSEKKNLETSQ